MTGYYRQKFNRGDVVHITADLPREMQHFRGDCDAIIMGSYRDLCRGHSDNRKREGMLYGVMYLDNGVECSWYEEQQLAFLRHSGAEEIERWREIKWNELDEYRKREGFCRPE